MIIYIYIYNYIYVYTYIHTPIDILKYRYIDLYVYYLYIYMGAYLGKGTYWQFFHKLDSRETFLLNAANHLKIFLIEFEMCLYEQLYFLYIRNPLFPIVAFISMFWQLRVNMLYPNNSFPIV